MVHRPCGAAAEGPCISQKIAHDKRDSAQRNRREGRKTRAKAPAGARYCRLCGAIRDLRLSVFREPLSAPNELLVEPDEITPATDPFRCVAA